MQEEIKCIQLDVDLEGYSETPSKDIKDFNKNLVEMIPILNTHRCGIDEEGGFVKRLKEGTYLAHICEHIIIAIQNILGIDVAYGNIVYGDMIENYFNNSEVNKREFIKRNIKVELIN